MSINGDLRRLLIDPVPVNRGVVSVVTSDSIYVSSSGGLKEFVVNSPATFRVGDGVRFQGNVYLGKLPSKEPGTTYVV